MENLQTLNYKSNITMLHNLIINTGNQVEKFERFKVGCKPTECEIFNLMFLDRIVCSDICYIEEKEFQTIRDFLILKTK